MHLRRGIYVEQWLHISREQCTKNWWYFIIQFPNNCSRLASENEKIANFLSDDHFWKLQVRQKLNLRALVKWRHMSMLWWWWTLLKCLMHFFHAKAFAQIGPIIKIIKRFQLVDDVVPNSSLLLRLRFFKFLTLVAQLCAYVHGGGYNSSFLLFHGQARNKPKQLQIFK